jgi:hypothetical protein
MFYNELKFIAHDEEGHVTYLEAGKFIGIGGHRILADDF